VVAKRVEEITDSLEVQFPEESFSAPENASNAIYDVDVHQAAQMLSVSQARLSQITSKGVLSFVKRKVGTRWRMFYRKDELDEILNQQTEFLYPRISTRDRSGAKAKDGSEVGSGLSGYGASFESKFQNRLLSEATSTEACFEEDQVVGFDPLRNIDWDFTHRQKDSLNANQMLMSRPSAQSVWKAEAEFTRLEFLNASLQVLENQFASFQLAIANKEERQNQHFQSLDFRLQLLRNAQQLNQASVTSKVEQQLQATLSLMAAFQTQFQSEKVNKKNVLQKKRIMKIHFSGQVQPCKKISS
jgi:hypothetical protein